jgi:hypothetical protein
MKHSNLRLRVRVKQGNHRSRNKQSTKSIRRLRANLRAGSPKRCNGHSLFNEGYDSKNDETRPLNWEFKQCNDLEDVLFIADDGFDSKESGCSNHYDEEVNDDYFDNEEGGCSNQYDEEVNTSDYSVRDNDSDYHPSSNDEDDSASEVDNHRHKATKTRILSSQEQDFILGLTETPPRHPSFNVTGYESENDYSDEDGSDEDDKCSDRSLQLTLFNVRMRQLLKPFLKGVVGGKLNDKAITTVCNRIIDYLNWVYIKQTGRPVPRELYTSRSSVDGKELFENIIQVLSIRPGPLLLDDYCEYLITKIGFNRGTVINIIDAIIKLNLFIQFGGLDITFKPQFIDNLQFIAGRCKKSFRKDLKLER